MIEHQVNILPVDDRLAVYFTIDYHVFMEQAVHADELV
jgi:hypothetical protein